MRSCVLLRVPASGRHANQSRNTTSARSANHYQQHSQPSFSHRYSPEHILHIQRKDAAREALRHAVVHLDGLIQRLELHDVEDGHEQLMLRDLRRVRDLDDGWLHVVAALDAPGSQVCGRVHGAAAQDLTALTLDLLQSCACGQYAREWLMIRGRLRIKTSRALQWDDTITEIAASKAGGAREHSHARQRDMHPRPRPPPQHMQPPRFYPPSLKMRTAFALCTGPNSVPSWSGSPGWMEPYAAVSL